MAKAPTPGVGRRATQSADTEAALAQKVTISCKAEGRELAFSLADLGPRDDMACRKATGWNVSELIGVNTISGFEVLAIWWLARRSNGEPDLSFDDVLDAYPTNADLLAAEFSSPEVEAPDEDDSPEA